MTDISTAPATSRDAITAVILAGGASSRMQQPKALLVWRGQRFIDHLIAQLRPQVARIAISAPADAELATLALPLLPDPFGERRGPLAGMLAGLRHSRTPLTLFVPCDSPLLAPDLVARLYTALRQQNADIAYAQCGADAHYLYALVRSDLDDALARYMEHDDYAVRRWFATVHGIAVDFETPIHFLNINTPADLALLPAP